MKTQCSTADHAYSRAVISQLEKKKPVARAIVEKGFFNTLLSIPKKSSRDVQLYLEYFDADSHVLSKMLLVALQTQNYEIFEVLQEHGAQPTRHAHALLKAAALQMSSVTALEYLLQHGLTAESDGLQTFETCVNEHLCDMLRIFLYTSKNTHKLCLYGLKKSIEKKDIDLSEYFLALMDQKDVPKSLREKYVHLVLAER